VNREPSSTPPRQAAPSAPEVVCDYCEAPMATPRFRNPWGEIPGTFKCSLCIEDELQARVCQ
jgi:hypothetical protein